MSATLSTALHTEAAPRRASPDVAVVMPVCNVEAFVGNAVNSVLAQTMQDFELIVIDDESRDGSMDIVRALTAHDPRARILRQANRGLAGARNTGIAAARGKYVALLDSDDTWGPDKLALQLDQLRSQPVDVSCCGSELVGTDGARMGLHQAAWTGTASPEDVFFGRVVRNGSVPMIRRDVLERARLPDLPGDRAQYFDESLRRSEDVECWVRLAIVGRARFGSVLGTHTQYRIRGLSLSADTIRQLESWDAACSRIEAYAPEFIARVGAQARAMELRYLARRAFQQRDRGLAMQLATDAVRAWPAILWREPAKTVTTLAACLALRALPAPMFGMLLRRAAPSFNAAT